MTVTARFSEPEPWRTKVVEPIRLLPEEDRAEALARAGWNVFRLRSDEVFVDLLTDSGTGAMSARQWAGMLLGDEAYAGARSWYRFLRAVRQVTGFDHVLPAHQGRGAESVYARAFLEEGDLVLGNLHFDTTRAHIRNRGAVPMDVLCDEGADPDDRSPFKGNADLDKAARALDRHRGRAPLFILTLTANTNGGQPVSLANARAVAGFCRAHGMRLLIDAARFAENAFLVREREEGQGDRSVWAIARDFFALADGAAMSGKKDALVNTGGFLALRDGADYERCLPWAILHEGFPTYGGLAGRDLEAMARGLLEGTDEAYLAARIGQVRLLHELLSESAVPLVHPAGGHCVMIDAGRFLEHVPRDLYPAESLGAALYLAGGVRAVGLGALAFSEPDPVSGEVQPPPFEHLRLAVPRRTYSDNHLAYVSEVMAGVWEKRQEVGGLRAVRVPETLPHFTAVLEPA